MNSDENLIFQKQTVMKIDASAIAHNVQVIRETIGSARLIAVIKENGYGMGLKREYDILKNLNINFFAVTNANEALALRRFGCKEDILLMSPSFEKEEAAELLQNNIIFMLCSMKQAVLLKELADETRLTPRVHLAIETGMGRYGFLWNRIPDLSALPAFLKIEGCYSHLNGKPSGYEKEARRQLERLLTATESLKKQGIDPGIRHICNSAATMSLGSLGLDAVRCGSAIIGKCARGGSRLKNAVWLEAPICMVAELPKGSTIGYQACAVLKRDSRLGLVRAGHGDGIMLGYADNPEPLIHGVIHLTAVKLLKNRYRKTVLVTGHNGKKARVPYVGRSGVAHVMIDLTDTSFAEGDMVQFHVNPLFVHPSIPKEVES
ncbi:MAG: alanine racemase [Lachnospiraceae bacterium]|nr:alanine racemase [Lachnospiraceae bacterium]MDY4969702.1 alanine racemase [Lachnospiraceae bacterium]